MDLEVRSLDDNGGVGPVPVEDERQRAVAAYFLLDHELGLRALVIDHLQDFVDVMILQPVNDKAVRRE